MLRTSLAKAAAVTALALTALLPLAGQASANTIWDAPTAAAPANTIWDAPSAAAPANTIWD
ncbi:hypothetical protein [Streptomyces rubellomurinus]|uniref:Uncharacterized protein n=2 Tax=Streptomyces TaxID=1883 RepID=A0A0F2TL50_STRR3|nr:hypothetical protein [Streptomyces rubellomurinus]KJS62437.1 hypothetical protein VM95_08555 [Streptomyces rubellomurinus]